MRTLYLVRAVPHVPRRDLLGRPDRVYFGNTAADAAKAGFDDSLIYLEIPRPHAQRKFPMIQLMHDEALEAFRAWERQPNELPY